MPFQSYEAAPWQAAVAAGRFIKEGHAHAVKLEGGERVADSIRAILKANVPVMGHVGLTPQSIHQQGGYRVQGKSRKEFQQVLREAKLLEKLGVFALVIEGVPFALGKKITQALKIPSIGIGAGPYCDGQILVLDDMLGLSEAEPPKFVKKYADLRKQAVIGLSKYVKDVRTRRFPTLKNSY
jgi:3-methyl-2-oxobutanoate hydroxymethyltransferase